MGEISWGFKSPSPHQITPEILMKSSRLFCAWGAATGALVFRLVNCRVPPTGGLPDASRGRAAACLADSGCLVVAGAAIRRRIGLRRKGGKQPAHSRAAAALTSRRILPAPEYKLFELRVTLRTTVFENRHTFRPQGAFLYFSRTLQKLSRARPDSARVSAAALRRAGARHG